MSGGPEDAPERRRDRYREGWNDRVTGGGGEYGKAYLDGDGKPRSNGRAAEAWTVAEREEYVRGWTAAREKVTEVLAGLILP